MTPEVVLLADAGPGIGWGHAVRQLALAEALVAKKVRTLFVTRTRTALRLDWPCPVRVADEPDLELIADLGTRCVVDGVDERLAYGPTLIFDDYGTGLVMDGVVDPHFGAAARHNGVEANLFLGPRWAPLRKPFNWTGARTLRWSLGGSVVFHYRPQRGGTLTANEQAAVMAGARYAMVPPSMTALECLSVGVPVVLTLAEAGPAHAARLKPLGDAMVAAGVAEWDTDDGVGRATDPTTAKEMSERGMEAVDGRGADRLAEWLADS